MVKRIPMPPSDDWLREEPEAVRAAWIEEQQRLGRPLTEDEREAIRRKVSK